jgi:hypothetical protein
LKKKPWVEDESEVDEMTVPAIKMQLEKYRSRIKDISIKSELNKMRRPELVTILKTVIGQYTASHSHVVQTEQAVLLPVAHQPHGPQLPRDMQQPLHIEDSTVIDKLLVPQLKAQLELYRSCTNVPKKSEINQLKKAGLVDLLKLVVAQYKQDSQASETAIDVQNIAQAEGSTAADDAPTRMEDLSKIRSSKTTKTVLKAQLELYRSLVPNMDPADQLEGKKKNELVDLLVNAVQHYKSSQA